MLSLRVILATFAPRVWIFGVMGFWLVQVFIVTGIPIITAGGGCYIIRVPKPVG